MLRRNLYYQLKPFLPLALRVRLRQIAARRILKTVGPAWSLDPAAGVPPPDWPGWPQGKKFAFALTHDVESSKGLNQVRELAAVEKELGFRSCFNFIPEGSYRVPSALRHRLTDEGFEIGIHDLHHDGKLYRSRAGFHRRAVQINRYLRNWGAAGFRSGFMLRQLDWMHELEIAYDSSTFDVDPFEPQPEAARTIFPFWVPPPADQSSRPGYVELPYTLPQDSTLFLILQETSPATWFRKLDWIAERGGMALVNVHPDYLQFPGSAPSDRTFPVENYRKLLEYARSRYGDSFWQPLPSQLAAWFKAGRRAATAQPVPISQATPSAAAPSPALLARKRAAVLLYSYYPSDPRPRRAAEAMVEAGMEVDLFCLSENRSELRRETIAGVNVFRLRRRHSRGSKWAYLRNYTAFIAAAFCFLLRRSGARAYDLVHVHNMPDVLVFAALPAKLRGARVLLDLHDPMPELMMSIYGKPAADWSIRLLKALERGSIRFSDRVFTPNVTFRKLFVSRSCAPEKISIVMNSPEEAVFDPVSFRRAPGRPGDFRLMHHGSIVYRHGIDLLVEAVALVRPRIPGIQLDIYGRREPFLDSVLSLANERGIGDRVHFHGSKTAREIGQAITDTHLGVIPNRRSAFTGINFPTRIFEYLAMNRLVLAPATEGIADYFAPDELPFYEQNNVAGLAARILWVYEQPSAAQTMLERGRRIYHDHLWSQEKSRFLTTVAGSLARLAVQSVPCPT